MIEFERMVSPEKGSSMENSFERALRPKKLSDYIGQPVIAEQLSVFIEAARRRQESLDHVLLFGPPGLGKTTLASVIAHELGVNLRQTSGPVIEKAGDLAAILTNIEENDVVFIDEVHRLSPSVEEILYPALEDYRLDVLIGDGPGARSVRLDLPPFTLVAATTRVGMLTNPLRDRFGIFFHLVFYSSQDLQRILKRSAQMLGVALDDDAANELACRSRGTPRIANRLLRRVRDFSEVRYDGRITKDVARAALSLLQVREMGLDHNDLRLLHVLHDHFDGGPAGLESIAAALAESSDTIEDVIEPFLIQQGFVQRTPRGRVLLPKASDYLKDLDEPL